MSLLDFVTHNSPDLNSLQIGQAKACDVYGTCAKLFRFLPQENRECGDRLTYQCLDPIDIRIEIQPDRDSEGETLMVKETGHHSEGSMSFWFNPNQQENVIANGGQPLYLKLSDSRYKLPGFDAEAVSGHADVIEYLGQKYIICQLQLWAGENCVDDGCDQIDHISGKLAIWDGDRYGEREANIDNDTFAHDGELQGL